MMIFAGIGIFVVMVLAFIGLAFVVGAALEALDR